MKKFLAAIIFLGFIAASFCSSGWMANAIKDMTSHGADHVSECCDYETSSTHNTEETIAVAPLLHGFNLPVALLILVLSVVLPQRKLPSYKGSYLPFYFHRFSIGVFQLE